MEEVKQILQKFRLKQTEIIISGQDNKPLIFEAQDELTLKKYFVHLNKNNEPNCKDSYSKLINIVKNEQQLKQLDGIKIIPKIIRSANINNYTLIVFEQASLNLKDYLQTDDYLLVKFILIIQVVLEDLKKIANHGFFISSLSINNSRINHDQNLILLPLAIKYLKEASDNEERHLVTSFIEQLIDLVKNNIDLHQYSETDIAQITDFTKILQLKQDTKIYDGLENFLDGLQKEITIFLNKNIEYIEKQVVSPPNDNQFERKVTMQKLLVSLSKNNHEELYKLSLLYSQNGNIDQAVNILKQSLITNPAFDQGYIELGRIYLYELMEIDKAATNFQKAIEFNALNADAYYYLGYCYLNKGQNDKSIPLYEKCLELNDTHALALLDLGWQNYLLGNLDKALLYYEQSLKYDRTIESTILNTINCLYIQNKKEEAISFIEQIQSFEGLVEYTHRLIVLDPLNSFLYHDLGIIQMLNGNQNKAYISFKKCLEVKPDYLYKDFLISQLQSLEQII